MTAIQINDIKDAKFWQMKGGSFHHVTTAETTTTLKVGVGLLKRIIVNKTSGTSLTLYDSASGSSSKVMGIIDLTNTGIIGSIELGIEFTDGLTFTTSGTSDITIVWN